MSIKMRAESTVNKLEKLLAESWSEEQEQKARKIIEDAMGDVIHEVCAVSEKVISQCCTADQDMAHKLNEEMKLARNALIANLSSLR
jgi:hypothetical protein